MACKYNFRIFHFRRSSAASSAKVINAGLLGYIVRRVSSLPAWVFLSMIVIPIFFTRGRVPGDDMVLTTLLNDMSLHDFIISRYNIWSGRVPINVLLVLFMREGLLPILKLIYSGAAVIIFYVISDIYFSKKNSLACYIALLYILCIPRWILWDSCLWLTGAGNYLLPFSCAVFAALPVIKHYKNEKVPLFLCFCGAFSLSFCVFSEQVLAIVLGLEVFLIISLLLFHKDIFKLLFVYLFLTIAFGLICITAPGNFVRTVQEAVRWYPDFFQVPISKRFIDAFHLLFNNLFREYPYFIFLFSISLFLPVIFSDNGYHKKVKFALSYFIVIFPLCCLFGLGTEKYGIEQIHFTHIFYPFFYIVSIAWIICIIASLVISTKTIELGILRAALFCGGIGTYIMMAFSPTIISSGLRTFFVFYMTITILFAANINRCFSILKEIINKSNAVSSISAEHIHQPNNGFKNP